MPGKLPLFHLLTIISVLLIVPLLKWLDTTARPGGDGFQNFGSALLIIFGCLLAAVVCAIAAARRGEQHRWLLLVAVLALIVPLYPLFL